MYKGRFAPSPTGPLHFGSLIAALISFLEAKRHSGEWHIRIDDIDHQRSKSEYSTNILNTLEQLGFEWDGEVIYQSQRQERYQEAIQLLANHQMTFACNCSRSQLPKGPYPGTCRNRPLNKKRQYSIRVKVDKKIIEFQDQFQGLYSQNLIEEIGDFVILRGDGIIAYHLATVVDDHDSGFNHIVRGIDLIDSTPRQIYLQQILNFNTPEYLHFPIVVNRAGEKLSKQTHAKSITYDHLGNDLYRSLQLLDLLPPTELKTAEGKEVLKWAMANWDIEKLPKARSFSYDESIC